MTVNASFSFFYGTSSHFVVLICVEWIALLVTGFLSRKLLQSGTKVTQEKVSLRSGCQHSFYHLCNGHYFRQPREQIAVPLVVDFLARRIVRGEFFMNFFSHNYAAITASEGIVDKLLFWYVALASPWALHKARRHNCSHVDLW